MTIRNATISDVQALVALNRGVQAMHAASFPERFKRDTSDDDVARAFSEMVQAPSGYWLVSEEKGPIGFLNAEFRDKPETWCGVAQRVCYLGGIVVAPGSRRAGVARALVEELKREANARGVSCIELDVWAFNETARAVFASLGFVPLMQRMTMPVDG